MKGFSFCKLGQYPSSGVYYCLPSKDCAQWLLYKTTEKDVDTGEGSAPDCELVHSSQYEFVVKYFNETFGVDISDIGKRCLPRGRVEYYHVGSHKWTILHGDDTPKSLKHQIVSEFGLDKVEVVWESDSYESMEESEKQRLISRVPKLDTLFKKWQPC